MPSAFIRHGSPLNTLERNRYTDAWRVLGGRVPRPRAILVISAHWSINATAVTARAPKPSISAEPVEAIVEATLHSKSKGETHWSTRTMA